MDNLGEDIKLLIVGYLTKELNQQDIWRLMQWVNANEENKEYYNRIKASWELAGMHNETEGYSETNSWKSAQSLMNKSNFNRNNASAKFYKIAATWLLFMLLGSLITLYITRKENKQILLAVTEIQAPMGAKSIVNLPDGTKVWLNAGSKLVYNTGFNDKDRMVQLTGEAYFHVKTDKSKPFVVKTTDVIVRALGTRFNVKAYPNEKTITATLEEGKIDVQLTSADNQKKVELKPNENIVFYKTVKSTDNSDRNLAKDKEKIEVIPGKLEVQAKVKTILYTSWKEDKWVIESEPLSLLIPKLERKFNLNITFSDKELMKYKFTGSFKNETLEQILTALSFTAPIEYTIEKDKITLRLNEQLKEKYTRIITPKN